MRTVKDDYVLAVMTATPYVQGRHGAEDTPESYAVKVVSVARATMLQVCKVFGHVGQDSLEGRKCSRCGG